MTDNKAEQAPLKDRKFIAIKDDRLWKSIASDFYTLGSLLAVVGIGIALDSAVLQIIGALMWILAVFAHMAGATKARFTINEARAELDRIEREGE